MKRYGLALLLAATLAPFYVTGKVSNSDAVSREVVFYAAMRPFHWDIFLYERGMQEPRRLTNDPALDYNPVFSPDGKWVVFSTERNGNPDLYAYDLTKDDGSILPLTQSDEMEDAPAFSPDGKSLAFVSTREGNADIYLMPFRPGDLKAAAEAKNLTNHPQGDFNPAFSPDGKKIAFSSNRDAYRASEIYVMNAGGTEQKRLTESWGWDGSPAWSQDGKQIYFYSSRDGGFRIWRMNHDGSDAQSVPTEDGRALSPFVLANGRIAYSCEREGERMIASVSPDGSDRRIEAKGDFWAPSFDQVMDRMVVHGSTAGYQGYARDSSDSFVMNSGGSIRLPDRILAMWAVRNYFPSLNRNGELISSAGFSTLVSSQMDGSGLREVKTVSGRTWSPSWSQDGQTIVFSVGPTFAGTSAKVDVWKVSGDGAGAKNLTEGSEANDAFPSFSGDDRWVVFRSGRDGNHEIYLMDAEGKRLQRLTNHSAKDTMPAFSPAMRQVAFTSNRSGNFEIYTLDIEPEGMPGRLRQITHSPGLDMHPKYSPDGKWLVFASDRGGINDEEPLIPVYNPQPYGDIYAVRLEDLWTVRLTHNKWEDGTPSWAFLP